ncbi:MAG: hypothetical protein JRN15_20740 [Nitrososphaerota archaeon]|nr:hypothetical protein [Nitrososphaerota archaeon]
MADHSPFELWSEGVLLDEAGKIEESKITFEEAAKKFFESTNESPAIAKALFEYSTLMDAYALIQEGRMKRDSSQFETSLAQFGRAADILRATLHFGFLASYVAACATLETAIGMEENEESFEALKGTNALLEQAKLALSFRDERHRLISEIDAMIKYSISKSLFVESRMLLNSDEASSEQKLKQSNAVMKEYEELASRQGMHKGRIDYFIVDDWERVRNGAFISCYPDADKIWLMNIGSNPAVIRTFANEPVTSEIGSRKSIALDMSGRKGKVRIVYQDLENQTVSDDGCLSLI